MQATLDNALWPVTQAAPAARAVSSTAPGHRDGGLAEADAAVVRGHLMVRQDGEAGALGSVEAGR